MLPLRACAPRTRAGARRCASRWAAQPRAPPRSPRRARSSAGSTRMSAPASSPSSPTSTGVHAACTGPRLPTTRISFTPAALIASIAASVVSVGASSAGVRASIRATSSATLPLPITTARSCERSNSRRWKSGWPLYQATNDVAGHEPGSSSPGIPSRRSVCAPIGVHDRVVELRQLAVGHVTAHLDVAEEAEAGSRRDPLERARDGLDVRVVGGDAEPDETPGRRQPVDQVDLDARLLAREQAGPPRRTRPGRSRRPRPGVEEPRSRGNSEDDTNGAGDHAENLGASRSDAPQNRTLASGCSPSRSRPSPFPREAPRLPRPGTSGRSRRRRPRSGCRS